jgi:hypothetical protein
MDVKEEKGGRENPTNAGITPVTPGVKGVSEERTTTKTPVKEQKNRRVRIFLTLTVIIAALVLAAYFSISVHQSSPLANASYPWTATYDVLFPDGQREYIGSTEITALSYQDEVIIDVDGDREKLVVGEQRLISERRAIITMLGIPLVETNYQMYVTFIGTKGSDDEFYLTIRTSQQVPQFLIDRILPSEIRARPV